MLGMTLSLLPGMWTSPYQLWIAGKCAKMGGLARSEDQDLVIKKRIPDCFTHKLTEK